MDPANNSGDQLVAIGGDDSKGPNPFARSRWPFYRPIGGMLRKKEGAHRPGAAARKSCNVSKTVKPIIFRSSGEKNRWFSRLFAPETAISAQFGAVFLHSAGCARLLPCPAVLPPMSVPS